MSDHQVMLPFFILHQNIRLFAEIAQIWQHCLDLTGTVTPPGVKMTKSMEIVKNIGRDNSAAPRHYPNPYPNLCLWHNESL